MASGQAWPRDVWVNWICFMQVWGAELGVQSQIPTSAIMFLFSTLCNKVWCYNCHIRKQMHDGSHCSLYCQYIVFQLTCVVSIVLLEMKHVINWHKNFINLLAAKLYNYHHERHIDFVQYAKKNEPVTGNVQDSFKRPTRKGLFAFWV